ncbi:uncharacterized protein ACLA_076680 [Aspergillus clavatus NRRL 1]|uniref:Uncharacterized protein n=1 Tax=Aspergillus clavatus (strain ATCC 1007 / CBS 513.65 / DSM 816 / NCTC 3887 / NRRL 1 / QM 1276 / 107) TaxID=344612 RepID=A1C8A6_ASPCL|nr:uncharacterized protein ACLA_076680 [Aspergillus clavatus NRRL 1]EAW14627.1 conserved hypothetical protein [Aspergillus clavatus NRRL 1]
MASETSFKLPGFSLPLDYLPDGNIMFPSVLETDSVSRLNTHRELLIMRAINAITDKSDWDQKIFNDGILAKWRKEIIESREDVTAKMLSWIVQEAKWKAKAFQETGQVVAFDVGVVKSDTAVSEELRQALLEAVHPLEDIPEDQKDYHPGSDQQVVDLVHPSLFPVIYGRTRILPDKRIELDSFESAIGEGQVLPVPPEEEAGAARDRWGNRNHEHKPYSRKFQWLPCDVQFAGDDECRIVTYVNNLHPRQHRPLYTVIEKVLAQAIPLWNTSLGFMGDFYQRIHYYQVEFGDNGEPEPEQMDSDEEDEQDFWERHQEWEDSRPVKRPEPGDFKPHVLTGDKQVNLRKDFADQGLQVIVKLANIELTPEKPRYEGGSWHIEGQLNEHICATAIYYYDSENITESTLEFRQRADIDGVEEISYPQSRHDFLQEVFNFDEDVTSYDEDADITQILGGVSTQQGRLLTFPNIVQHRVDSFGLADTSKPGHRKILALFLVDPHIRIISSANVPPQREDWWKERQEVVGRLLNEKLPAELRNMVHDGLEATPISMDEAKKYREELMEERSIKADEQNKRFETGGFSLCEH